MGEKFKIRIFLREISNHEGFGSLKDWCIVCLKRNMKEFKKINRSI